jgi:hypothetical protein
VLRDDVQIGFRILTGYDGTTPQWQEVTLGGSGATPWQNWTFSNTGGTYAVSGNGGAGQTSQSLVLTGLPMADAGVGWYQIVVKGGDFEKIYNLHHDLHPGAHYRRPRPDPAIHRFQHRTLRLRHRRPGHADARRDPGRRRAADLLGQRHRRLADARPGADAAQYRQRLPRQPAHRHGARGGHPQRRRFRGAGRSDRRCA